MRFFPFIVVAWMLPILLAPLQALFESTAHWTGLSAFAPLALVWVIVVGGGLVVATKAARSL